MPWWAAILIAVTATAIGYAIDAGSGHKALTLVFTGCYIAGCVGAVLAVRQSDLFTALVQPPLILFCAVPGAYWLFHGGTIGKFKDLLINCGYSLIERFPLMLGTAAGVLLIGLVRWYLGTALFDSIARKLSSLMTGDSDDDGGRRSAQRPARTRSRHARPPSEDNREPIAERRSRRRPRPQNDPHPRRNAHERPAPRSSRFDSYRSYQPSNPPGLPSPSTGTNVGVLDTSPMRATSPPTSPNADAPVPASQPTRHTIRSRRSATAGQLLATRGGTTTARSSGSIGGIVRGHRADHRLNPGNTTSNRERMCSAR